jgi:hypothetical protein
MQSIILKQLDADTFTTIISELAQLEQNGLIDDVPVIVLEHGHIRGLIDAALDLPEYQRKQIAMALIASTLTDASATEAFNTLQFVDETAMESADETDTLQ